MKKKILLSSILTIVLCLSLIAGSTFALFTSTSQVSIAATAGNVKMTAGIEITKVESVEGDENGTIEDENGFTYSYSYKDEDGTDGYTFINGGTATVTDSVLTMTEVTPGDKITLQVTGKNDSDIAILYRYKIDCAAGEDLMKGLVFTVNSVAVDKYMATYTSPWIDLAKGNDIAPVVITVELPVTAGNVFQNQTTEIRVIVEAIQANAVVEDNVDPVITYFNTAATVADAADLIADPFLPEVSITESIAGAVTIDADLADKTIYANGNDVNLIFTGNLDNVVIDGIVDTLGQGRKINLNAASGNVTITNSTFLSTGSNSNIAFYPGANIDITIDSCTFTGSGKSYAAWSTSAGEIIIKNSTFNTMGSWAILINGTQYGDFVIDNCTFNGCTDGIVKSGIGGAGASGLVEGNFVFTNNTIVQSAGHDNSDAKWFGVSYNGTATVSGNTLDGAAWEPGEAQGIVKK